MDDANFKRLQWQCRRGMLELDLFLQRFLQERYSSLNGKEQIIFERLLENNDQDLFVWLTGREVAVDPEMAMMVEMVRENVHDVLEAEAVD
jgi:antitoxin CptB